MCIVAAPFWERKTVLGGVLCCKIELFGQLW
jgi:hypothetical protein